MEYLQPNKKQEKRFTMIPHSIIDYMLKELTSAEFIIYMIIYRHILGWNEKESASVSYKQLLITSGFKSYSTISKALSGLEQKGIILIKKGDTWDANTYRLNEEYKILITENVAASTTKSVAAPTTKSVDIKYNKENKNKKALTPEELIPRLKNKKVKPLEKKPLTQESILLAGMQYKNYDVSHYPEQVRDIILKFCELWNIKPPERSTSAKGRWIANARELLKVFGEIPVEQGMNYVYQEYANDKAFDVFTIGSIINYANMVLSNFATHAKSQDYGGGFNFIPE